MQSQMWKRKVMMGCIALLIMLMLTIFFRYGTQQILVEKMHLDNAIIQTIFFDRDDLLTGTVAKGKKQAVASPEPIFISWQDNYPFKQEPEKYQTEQPPDFFKTMNIKINTLKNKISEQTSNYLMGYKYCVELSNRYKAFIGWNITSTNEDNGVITLADGYLSSFGKKYDVSEQAKYCINLAQFCKKNDVEFLYVQAPYKISKYQDREISGSLDFTNQNVDQFLSYLNQYDINYIDLRENIHDERMNHHAMFFKTDPHWKPESGLWATKIIAKYINDRYSYGIDSQIYDTNNFKLVCYKKYMFGSYGKKVTLAKAEPEDINFIYPKFATSIYYSIPGKGMDETGDFSVTYDMNQVKNIDYYKLYPYEANNHSNSSLTQIHNNIIKNGKKILFIKDSFGSCVAPFLSLSVEDEDILDLRIFTGSLETYIERTKPDIVVVLYYAGEYGLQFDDTSHTDLFDFR